MSRRQRRIARRQGREGFVQSLRNAQATQAALYDLLVRPFQQLRSDMDYRSNLADIRAGEEAARERDCALGDIDTARALSLCGGDARPGGSYIGCLGGTPLFNPTDKHEMIVGLAGSGKTTCVAYPKIIALAQGKRPESVVCIDVKGELWGSTAAGRAALDGAEPIVINPWCMYGIASARLNLFQDLIEHANLGRPTKDLILSRLRMIHASPDSKGANAWITIAAFLISAVFLAHFVECERDRANPATMADIGTLSLAQFLKLLTTLMESPACDGWVSDVAHKLFDRYQDLDDPKHFEWVMEEYASAWEMYGKGSVLRDETSATDFDFSELKRRPRAVYIMIPPRYLTSHGQYVALLLDVLIEIIASARGDVRTSFICDEFVNIPKAKSTLQALRLYRSANVRLVVFAQDRDGFSKYKDEGGYKPFEENSIGLYWGLRDGSHMRDIQERAGFRYQLVSSINASVGERINGGGFSASQQRVPILPVDVIGQIADGEAILEIPGQRLFVVDRPFWKELPFVRDHIRDLREHPLPDIPHL